MAQYYYITNNQERKGPYSPHELASLITPNTMVWTEGMTAWKPAREIAELASYLPQPKQKKSNAIIIGILVGVVIVLLGVLAFMLTQGDNTPTVNAPEATTVSEPAPQEPVADQPHKLTVIKVDAPYHLAPQAGHTYVGENLIDGDPSTVWALTLDDQLIECDSGLYWEPTFTINCSKLSYIIIRNGYGRSASAYKNNTRVKKVSVYVPDGEMDGYTLTKTTIQDTNSPQKITIPDDATGNSNIRKIILKFGDWSDSANFYPGAKWNDLCISEVEFWGYE